LCVDLKLIQHILSNLLWNAIKYSSANSQVILTVKLADNPPIITFQIRDFGIGIPAEEQQYLFDSFYRAKNVGKVSGTGLGLTIVAKAVDLHGGGIVVSSEVRKGTLFTVDIPVF
jgi:signal transduction histidine kinase